MNKDTFMTKITKHRKIEKIYVQCFVLKKNRQIINTQTSTAGTGRPIFIMQETSIRYNTKLSNVLSYDT